MAEIAEKFFLRTKILFKCDDDLWNRVRAYKKERRLSDLNLTVTELITTSLEKWEKENASVVYNKLGMKDLGF